MKSTIVHIRSLTLLLVSLLLFLASGAQAEWVHITWDNAETLIGKHFWATVVLRGEVHPIKDTGFTVIGIKRGDSRFHLFDVQVKLDDGRTGDVEGSFNPSWNTDSPEDRRATEALSIGTYMARVRAECQKLPALRIGMTPAEVAASKWGESSGEHTTETASHIRIQWVYTHGVRCTDDDTSGRSDSHPRYLYFEDGRLTTIER